MKTTLSSVAALTALTFGTALAGAQTAPPAKTQWAFESAGEAVQPQGLTKVQQGATAPAHHFGLYYSSCFNYYRTVWTGYYWTRVYVGTRCY